MLNLSDRLCCKRIFNHCLRVYLNISHLYCLDMLFDLSQSLSLSIFREKDYVSSTADRVDLVLFYFYSSLPIYCQYHRLIVMDLTSVFLFFFLVDCRIKSTATPLNPRARFRTCTGAKQISRPVCIFRINTPLLR